MDAGNYPSVMAWASHSYATADSFGAKADQWADTGVRLWADVDAISSNLETVMDDRRATVRATIRVRNYPDVRPKDRLTWLKWAETYQVESVHRGKNEIVCECYLVDGVNR